MVNFGWEYVFHCHILSHEEMDMMRPVSVAMPPVKPDGLAFTVAGSNDGTRLTLTWKDNSIAETGYQVQRRSGTGTWANIGAVLPSPLDVANTTGSSKSFTDTTFRWNSTLFSYRVVALNTVGYGAEFPSMTVSSTSDAIPAVRAPGNLTATVQSGTQVGLAWTDTALNENGFTVQRSTDGGTTFTTIATLPARNNVGGVTYADTTVTLGTTYTYRVAANSVAGPSAWSNAATVTVGVPQAPSDVTGTAVRQGAGERVTLNWRDNANNESGLTIQWSGAADFATVAGSGSAPANATTFTTGTISRAVTCGTSGSGRTTRSAPPTGPR